MTLSRDRPPSLCCASSNDDGLETQRRLFCCSEISGCPSKLPEFLAKAASSKFLQCGSALRTPSGRIVDILNGKRGISPKTALRLARFFGNGAMFWLNLQTAFD